MRSNDLENNLPPDNSFIAQSGTTYTINELLSWLNEEHYLSDYKNNQQPFSQEDIELLLKKHPTIRAACEHYYANNKLIGLMMQVKNSDEIFKEMELINTVLERLTQEYDGWGWIPDEVLSLQLSEPLYRFHKLIEKSNTKFLDFLISDDRILKHFFNRGFNEYIKSINSGQCSSGFATSFTLLFSKAQSAKGFFDYTLRQNKYDKLNKLSLFTLSTDLVEDDNLPNTQPRQKI